MRWCSSLMYSCDAVQDKKPDDDNEEEKKVRLFSVRVIYQHLYRRR